MSESPGKLRLGALVTLVVGSMIGGGIFFLPQNIAASGFGNYMGFSSAWGYWISAWPALLCAPGVLLFAKAKHALGKPISPTSRK